MSGKEKFESENDERRDGERKGRKERGEDFYL